MSSDRWALLESIQNQLNSLSDLPPGIMIAMADRIEEAVSSASRAPLKALSDQLAGLFNSSLRLAPIEAVNAVRGSVSADTIEGAAYRLGQLSFAQLLTAQAAGRRADDDFLMSFQDSRYKEYIKALIPKDLTGIELAEVTTERVETVSRKLQRLRELGITDFRREGTRSLNFLTPAARAVVGEVKIIAQEEVSEVVSMSLASRKEELPEHMRQSSTFGMLKKAA